jgi:predicted RNA-binding Zn ribbon-like protein
MAYTFDNGRLCVDFLATEYGRPYFRVETINSRHDLAQWMRQSGVLTHPGPTDALDPGRGHALRRLLTDVLFPARPGRYLDRARHRLNLIARGPRVVLQWRGEDRVIRRGGYEEFRTELAIDALDLLSRPAEHARLRVCALTNCQRVFLDRSAGGHRRWCSTSCRGRHSSATHRAAAWALRTPALANASAFSLPGSPA